MKNGNVARRGPLVVLAVLLFAYIGNRCSILFSLSDGTTIEKLLFCIDSLGASIQAEPFLFLFDSTALLWSLCVGIVPLFVWLYFLYDFTNDREGEEHGSAKWGSIKSNRPYADLKNFRNNILLSQHLLLSLGRAKSNAYNRNKNVLVEGGSGSGKTRFFVKPQLMQMHSSYIVTEPKGVLPMECGKMLHDNGYEIRVFNTVDFKRSMHYNPFAYIKKEEDILKLVEALVQNTSSPGEKADFWVKAERLLYQALIAYIWYECKPAEKNFSTLLYLLNNMEASEEDESFVSPIDILFEELETKSPMHFAVLQYKKYKKAAGKTAKSILISCGARLAPFDIEAIREITSFDEMDFESIGDRKVALFLVTDEMDSTYDFIVGLALTQIFSTLINHAKACPGGRLPVHVRILGDELMNICQIPNLKKIIAVIRSYEISLCPIIQNRAQIKSVYKDDAATIIGNCDTKVFLGSDEEETTKAMSAQAGKATVRHKNGSETHGSKGSWSSSQQLIQRDLITPDEVATLNNAECIVKIRGERPFKDQKYDITKHPQYKNLSDDNPKNEFKYWEQPTAQSFLENVKTMSQVDFEELNQFL